MAKIRKIYDQTIKPDGSKTTIYPITSTRAVYTPEGETLDSYLKDGYFHGADLRGYKTVSNVTDLPTTENQFGWLIGEDLYVWVGTGGNALGGLYQNCGHFRTPYVPDDEDLVADSNNELKLKDRTVEDGGMGYVILRKNKTFAEQLTQENTIYEIRYDFNLDGESVEIPDGCILKFSGGSLSNGTIEGDDVQIEAEKYKIFDNVSFSGQIAQDNLFHILWFVDKASSIFYQEANKSSAVDCSDQINAAFASGARRFIWDSDRFYYLRNPIEVWGNIDIYSDVDEKFANSRSMAVVNGQNPCVYSYDIVTMFKYHAIVDYYYKDCINLSGITFLCAKPFSNPTTDQDTPIVFVETGCPESEGHESITNYTTLWGLRIDFIVRGINRNGGIIDVGDVLVNDTISTPSYTGISINATRGNITYVRIDGYYTKLFNAIATNITSPYWFSNITIYADINQCGRGGLFNGVGPIFCYGTGQPSMIWTNARARTEAFYRGSSRVFIYGYVWDLGSSRRTSSNNVYQTCYSQYDTFRNITSDTTNYASNSFTQPSVDMGGRVIDCTKLPTLYPNSVNLLNCIFNNRDIVNVCKYELIFPGDITEYVLNYDLPNGISTPVLTSTGTNFTAYNVFNIFRDNHQFRKRGIDGYAGHFGIVSNLQTKVHIYVEFLQTTQNVYKGLFDYFLVYVPQNGSSSSATPESPVVTVVDASGTRTMTPSDKIVSPGSYLFIYSVTEEVFSIDVTYTIAGGNSGYFKAATLYIPCDWMDFNYVQSTNELSSQTGVAANTMAFDLSRKRPIYLENNKWYDADGIVSGTERAGSTANRPTSGIRIGFQYYDTDAGKPIWVKAISGDTITWVDATGAEA